MRKYFSGFEKYFINAFQLSRNKYIYSNVCFQNVVNIQLLETTIYKYIKNIFICYKDIYFLIQYNIIFNFINIIFIKNIIRFVEIKMTMGIFNSMI